MPPRGPDPPGKKSMLVQLANYSQLAFIFPAATVAGWLIGLTLDHWLHTKCICSQGFTSGILAVFVESIRTATSAGSDQLDPSRLTFPSLSIPVRCLVSLAS